MSLSTWFARRKFENALKEASEGNVYKLSGSLKAAAKDALHTVAGVLMVAVATYFADPQHVTEAAGKLPPWLAGVIPASALAAFVRNWLAHRNDAPPTA